MKRLQNNMLFRPSECDFMFPLLHQFYEPMFTGREHRVDTTHAQLILGMLVGLTCQTHVPSSSKAPVLR